MRPRTGSLGLTSFLLFIAAVLAAGPASAGRLAPDQVRRVAAASEAILELCVGVGGSITGEHGVGMDKIESMHLIFSENDLRQMLTVRDVFNPNGLCNPGKVIPTFKTCRYCGFGMEDFKHKLQAPHGVSAA